MRTISKTLPLFIQLVSIIHNVNEEVKMTRCQNCGREIVRKIYNWTIEIIRIFPPKLKIYYKCDQCLGITKDFWGNDLNAS